MSYMMSVYLYDMCVGVPSNVNRLSGRVGAMRSITAMVAYGNINTKP